MSISWQIGEQIVAYPHSREYGVTSQWKQVPIWGDKKILNQRVMIAAKYF